MKSIFAPFCFSIKGNFSQKKKKVIAKDFFLKELKIPFNFFLILLKDLLDFLNQ